MKIWFKITYNENCKMPGYTSLSSLLFLVPACYNFGSWMTLWFSMLTCTSVIHHSCYNMTYTGKTMIAYADRAIAHGITIRTMYEALYMPFCSYIFIYWMCIAYIVVTYYCLLLQRHGIHSPLHESIHIMSVIGTLSFCKAQRLLK